MALRSLNYSRCSRAVARLVSLGIIVFLLSSAVEEADAFLVVRSSSRPATPLELNLPPTREVSAIFRTQNSLSYPLQQSAVAVEFSSPSASNKNDTDATSSTTSATSASANPEQQQQQQQHQQLNQALQVLVEQAGHAADRNQAVQAAATAEELWRKSSCSASSLGLVLQAWARVSQRLLELHQHHYSVSSTEPSSTITSNSAAIDAILENVTVDVTQSSIYHSRDAAQHAEELWREAARQLSGDDDNRATTVFANAVLEAWAKSREADAAEHCQAIFKEVMPNSDNNGSPDPRPYQFMLEALAYSNAPDCLEQLHRWYDRMLQQQQPTTATTQALVTAYSRYARQKSPYDPTATATNTQLAQAAIQRLRDLQAAFAETRNANQRPDAPLVTAVMECLAQCRTVQAAHQAEELFMELKRSSSDQADQYRRYHLPNIHTYAALILAWSRSGARYAPQRTQEFLEEVLHHKNPSVQPNSVLFTHVILSWARSGRPDQAAQALALLKRLRGLVKEKEAAKNSSTSSSNSKQLSMQLQQLAPSVQTYNAVLDACARTRGTAQQELAALQIAFAVHKALQLDDNVEENSHTFATLLRAVGALLPSGSDERNPVATAVMKKAIAAGQVDRNVIKTLQRACDAAVFTKLLKDDMVQLSSGHFDFDSIPAQWSRNLQT